MNPADLPARAAAPDTPSLEEGALLALGAMEHLSVERDRDALHQGMLRILADLAAPQLAALYLRAEESFELSLTVRGQDEPRRPEILPTDLPDEPAIDGARQVLAASRGGAESVALDERTVMYGLYDARGLAAFLLLRFPDLASTRPWWIGSFLKVYQNLANLIADAECDTLTGLFNRKTFESRMSRVLAMQRDAHENAHSLEPGRRAVRPGEHHWLAVVDIDHFKSINDRFGHLYGDEVLILLARLMMRGFRMEDRLFRFGGEEFVIVLSPCAASGAAAVLERFRNAIATYAFPQVGRVTASIGYTRIRAQDVASVTVGRADEALYHAKRSGRDRVCNYELLAAAGSILPARGIEGGVELF